MSIAHKIKNLFFTNEILQMKNEMEGQKCVGQKYILGSKAGPSKNISNLLHEISHFAEREPKKLLEFPVNGWGFSYGKYWEIGSKFGYEPQTSQQVHREARVWAYQLNAQRHFNISDSPYDLVRCAVFLPAWCHYQWETSEKTDVAALNHLANYVEQLSTKFTFQRLIEEFQIRIQYLTRNS